MTAAKPNEKFVNVNDLRLRYLDWGTEGRLPLVCLHGHSGQAHIWDEFADAVCPYYHVYALDQRGHGGSQWSSNGYDRDRFVEDLKGFMDSLGLPSVTLVGLSMGGWHSLLYASDHQDRVEKIIIVDIAPEPSPDSLRLQGTRPTTPLEFDNLDDVIIWERGRNPWASDARLRQDIIDKTRQRDDGKWVWKADSALFNYVLPDLTDVALQERYWNSLEDIRAPIMEVRGKESPLVSDEIVEKMMYTNPGFTSVDVENAGHVVCVDQPQKFIEVTRKFLGIPG